MQKPRLIVIVGPTASGKSDLAVKIAKKIGGEVISADSRQVYKGLDIGTGKITKKEMQGVPHHLLDVVSPKQRFTASDFKILAEKVIDEILERKKTPIICGGTGFYIDVLFGDKQIPEVPPNLKLRKELDKKSPEELFKILEKLDPERATNIEKQNPRRLVRAIEICKALGSVPKQILNPNIEIRPVLRSLGEGGNKFEIIKLGIEIPNEDLKERINKRLEKRLRMGMINEAKKLHTRGLSYKRMRELGLEYSALADFLQSKLSRSNLDTRLRREIWQYAKRQKLWFNRDKNIIWLEPKIKQIEKVVKKFL